MATEVLGRGCSLQVPPPCRSQGTGMAVWRLGHHGLASLQPRVRGRLLAT